MSSVADAVGEGDQVVGMLTVVADDEAVDRGLPRLQAADSTTATANAVPARAQGGWWSWPTGLEGMVPSRGYRYSMPENFISFSKRCRASMRRTVPERDRITRDSVMAPSWV
jgi:hypothetical protein